MEAEIRAYVEKLKLAYDGTFKELDFLAPNSPPLTLRIEQQAVCFVRFELRGTGCLHLHSLQFLGPLGEVLQIPRQAAVSASSHYGRSARVVHQRKLFQGAGAHVWGIHTKKQVDPWVQISFQEPVDIHTILITNRRDHYSHRAAGLVVTVSRDGKDWTTIFDAGRSADAFHVIANDTFAKWCRDHAGEPVAVRDFVSHVFLSEYRAAHAIFSRLKDSEDLRRALQKAVSELVLQDRQLEWTSHGARRSFRFWSLQEKVDYVKFAAGVVDELRGLSPDTCFGFGSVLSLVRDQDLIPHDDDLDIIMAFEHDKVGSISGALGAVRVYLESRGYKVAGNFMSHWHVSKGSVKVDVFVGLYENSAAIGWFPGARGALDRDDLFPPQATKMLGVDCLVPRDPEKYLEVVYGKSWRTPLPGWQHDWDRSSYEDIA